MTTRVASDWGHGTYCPETQGRQRLAREDEQSSTDLARRLNLRSWKLAHGASTNTCACGCGQAVPESMRAGYATERCRRKMDARKARLRKRAR